MRRLLQKLTAIGERVAVEIWITLCVLLCLALCLDAVWWRSLPFGVVVFGPVWLVLGSALWFSGTFNVIAKGRNPIFWIITIPFILLSLIVWGTVWYLRHPGATFVSDALLWVGFSYGLVLVVVAGLTFRWLQRQVGWTTLVFWGLGCLALIPVWQWGLFAAEFFGWEMIRYYIARIGLITIFISGLAWTIRWVDLKALEIDEQRLTVGPPIAKDPSLRKFQSVFILATLLGVFGVDRFFTGRHKTGVLKLIGLGALTLVGCLLFYKAAVDARVGSLSAFGGLLINVPFDAFQGERLAQGIMCVYILLFGGCLVDVVLLTVGQYHDGTGRPVLTKPLAARTWRIGPLEAMNLTVAPVKTHVGNPLDLGAWYYGHANQKLKQSLNTTASYTVAFALVALLLMLLPGCLDIYEMPAGGGDPQLKRKVVKVQKVKKKVYVVNPFSAILFNPDIERIQLKLEELTKHLYQVGQGKGKGAGFAGGTRRGLVRFIRLKYSSGDWDQDLDLNSDLNMLVWYAAQTGHKTAKKPEVRTVRQLDAFPVGKSPPMVYLTGQRSLSLSRSEIETLREYITTKHGMLFADNGGSSGWHSQFFNLMRQVLPRTDPRTVPLDHPVHDGMPFLPIVAPHGGRTAYMWVVENRIVAYYHPGDIGDAWADGHAGVPRPVWEACYRLGGNIILYSHSEYSKWLQAQKKKD